MKAEASKGVASNSSAWLGRRPLRSSEDRLRHPRLPQIPAADPAQKATLRTADTTHSHMHLYKPSKLIAYSAVPVCSPVPPPCPRPEPIYACEPCLRRNRSHSSQLEMPSRILVDEHAVLINLSSNSLKVVQLRIQRSELLERVCVSLAPVRSGAMLRQDLFQLRVEGDVRHVSSEWSGRRHGN